VCAILVVLLWLQLEQGTVQAGRAQAVPAPDTAQVVSPRFEFPPLEAFNEVVERNLFDRSRRPPGGEHSEQAEAAAREPLALTLTGVVITPQTRLALLSDNTPDNIVRLRPGESFGRWVLVDVRRNGVTLRSGTERRELPLDDEQK
jgi:hypothetical protein